MEISKVHKESLVYNRMIAAARKLFVFENGKGITIKNIVDEANVGRGSFYKHFSNPGEVLEVLKNKEEEDCWKKMLEYYCRIPTGTFSQKIERMAVNLTRYIELSSAFQRLVGEDAAWYKYLTESGSSDPEYAHFLEDLNTYAKSTGISENQAKMNVHILLTAASRYAAGAINEKIPLTVKEVRTFIRKTAGLLFPEE